MTQADYINRLRQLSWSDLLMRNHAEAMRAFDNEEELAEVGDEVMSLFNALVGLDLAIANGEPPAGMSESNVDEYAARLLRMLSALVDC